MIRQPDTVAWTDSQWANHARLHWQPPTATDTSAHAYSTTVPPVAATAESSCSLYDDLSPLAPSSPESVGTEETCEEKDEEFVEPEDEERPFERVDPPSSASSVDDELPQPSVDEKKASTTVQRCTACPNFQPNAPNGVFACPHEAALVAWVASGAKPKDMFKLLRQQVLHFPLCIPTYEHVQRTLRSHTFPNATVSVDASGLAHVTMKSILANVFGVEQTANSLHIYPRLRSDGQVHTPAESPAWIQSARVRPRCAHDPDRQTTFWVGDTVEYKSGLVKINSVHERVQGSQDFVEFKCESSAGESMCAFIDGIY